MAAIVAPIEVFLVLIGTAVWVFFDAPTRGMSRLWAVGVLVLWIVAFPWYLVARARTSGG